MVWSRWVDTCTDLDLTPGQRTIGRVAYDGINPADMVGEEREIARELFGPVNTVPELARGVFAACCGARGGKSSVLIATRVTHLALTLPITRLAPGEKAEALIVAPDLSLAQQTLRFCTGIVGAASQGTTADSLALLRPDGRTVSIRVRAASARGRAGRGRSLVAAGLDEAAFFRDASYRVNDKDIYEAAAPRIMPGGQIIIGSTPWAELGLLWDFIDRNWGDPKDALVCRATTLQLRDHPETRAVVARERMRDPVNALREFDAQFVSANADQFFDAASVRQSVVDTADIPERPMGIIGIGADFGFSSDSSACAAVVRDDDVYYLVELIELVPGKRALIPSDTVRRFAKVATHWGAVEVMADGHYQESIREHLDAQSLDLTTAPTGAAGKAETYQFARQVIHSGKLRLGRGPLTDRLVHQLVEVRSRATSGGAVSITSPRWQTGGHGDLVSALVLAIWQAHETDEEDMADERVEEYAAQLMGKADATAWRREQKIRRHLDRERQRRNEETLSEGWD